MGNIMGNKSSRDRSSGEPLGDGGVDEEDEVKGDDDESLASRDTDVSVQSFATTATGASSTASSLRVLSPLEAISEESTLIELQRHLLRALKIPPSKAKLDVGNVSGIIPFSMNDCLALGQEVGDKRCKVICYGAGYWLLTHVVLKSDEAALAANLRTPLPDSRKRELLQFLLKLCHYFAIDNPRTSLKDAVHLAAIQAKPVPERSAQNAWVLSNGRLTVSGPKSRCKQFIKDRYQRQKQAYRERFGVALQSSEPERPSVPRSGSSDESYFQGKVGQYQETIQRLRELCKAHGVPEADIPKPPLVVLSSSEEEDRVRHPSSNELVVTIVKKIVAERRMSGRDDDKQTRMEEFIDKHRNELTVRWLLKFDKDSPGYDLFSESVEFKQLRRVLKLPTRTVRQIRSKREGSFIELIEEALKEALQGVEAVQVPAPAPTVADSSQQLMPPPRTGMDKGVPAGSAADDASTEPSALSI